MPAVSDKDLAIAKVYSGSMLALAEARGEADALLAELFDLAAYLDKDPEFDRFCSSPMIDSMARERTIEKLFRGKASDLLVDSLQVLNRKERLGVLRAVVEGYRLDHEELRGVVDVHVRTAVPLTKTLKKQIREVAGRYTGKTAQLVETVDESIIGGMIVNIGDQKIDASVTSRLTRLGEALARRASQEIHSGKEYVTGAVG